MAGRSMSIPRLTPEMKSSTVKIASDRPGTEGASFETISKVPEDRNQGVPSAIHDLLTRRIQIRAH